MSAKEKFRFKALLIKANTPTSSGYIYPEELCQNLCDRLNTRPYIVIQEMNEVERKAKDKPLYIPWKGKDMASIKSAEFVDGNLIIEAECRLSRDGKKLSGMVQNLGLDELIFAPIGIGTQQNNIIDVEYELTYVVVHPVR